MSTENKKVETTGHVWDDDLQEYNNPLPKWWLWTFYFTIVFAIVYWVVYPSFPIAKTFLPGVMKMEVKNLEGETVYEGHWNTRAKFAQDMYHSSDAVKQREYLQKVTAASYEEIVKDPDMMAFARSMGKVAFADNCAACHGTGGQPPSIGSYPNLADDAWLYGGDFKTIETTIMNGRKGNMPGFPNIEGENLDNLATYVLSIAGEEVDMAAAKKGKAQFSTCAGCHGADGAGNPALGAAKLNDRIWTKADVPGAATIEEKKARVKDIITHGFSRQMPAIGKERLSPETVKILTVYVYQLGGGQ